MTEPYEDWLREDLVNEAEARNLVKTGTKAELAQRLRDDDAADDSAGAAAATAAAPAPEPDALPDEQVGDPTYDPAARTDAEPAPAAVPFTTVTPVPGSENPSQASEDQTDSHLAQQAGA